MPKLNRLATFALFAGAMFPLITTTPAAAVVVNIHSVFYDVSVTNSAYDISSHDFELPSLGGRMPWWGDDMLALDFSKEVYNQLGAGWDANYGPVFAYDFDSSLNVLSGIAQSLNNPSLQLDVTPASNAMASYAIATAPAPGPLPWMGAVASFGWARQLRQRIRNRSNGHSSVPSTHV